MHMAPEKLQKEMVLHPNEIKRRVQEWRHACSYIFEILFTGVKHPGASNAAENPAGNICHQMMALWVVGPSLLVVILLSRGSARRPQDQLETCRGSGSFKVTIIDVSVWDCGFPNFLLAHRQSMQQLKPQRFSVFVFVPPCWVSQNPLPAKVLHPLNKAPAVGGSRCGFVWSGWVFSSGKFQAEAMAKASADRGRAQRVAEKREAMPESPVSDGIDIWIWMDMDGYGWIWMDMECSGFLVENYASWNVTSPKTTGHSWTFRWKRCNTRTHRPGHVAGWNWVASLWFGCIMR